MEKKETTYSVLTQIVSWVRNLFAKKTDIKIYIGTCSTAAATNPKICTVEEFPTVTNNGVTEPVVGTVIGVKFNVTNTSTSTTPELNVNGTGAYRIWYNNAALASAKSYFAGYAHRYNYYVWDGEYWVFLSHSVDNNTTYANYSFGNGLAVQNNTADATAITATYASYALTANGRVSVVFTHDVLANSTLNINSKGAKAIYYYKDGVLSPIEANMIKAHDVATFVYNGTYYVYVSKWFSGSYNDLKDKPTKVSEFTNDSGYLTSETDPTVPAWAKASSKPSYTASEVGALPDSTVIPSALSDLSDDATHRLVTDTEKATWNGKGTYSKPSGGIPKTDLANDVQTSLGKADTALQSFTESDPVFTASAAHGISSTDISNWNNKVDAETGKGLSTNDYTTTEKTKLAGIEAGAEVNVQGDWAQNDTTADDYIKNRTHYVESVSTSDVWYQTNVEVGSASSSPGAYSGTFNLTEGKTYNVTISQGNNTKTYEGIVCENNTTVSGLFLNKNWSNPMHGAETTSDAFYILVQASSVILASADVYGSGCTVQVSEVTETIHKLDPKYLPDNVNQLESITTSKSGKVTTVTFEQTNGTETQFQVTDGADGTNGKSAYQVAVDNGYSGTEAQWLASLKGADGVSLGEVELTQEVTTATDSVPANKAVYDKVQRLTETDIEDILATGEAKEPTLPFGYTELEWIYNENGSSGIDTGLIPNDANWRFVGSWARMKTSGGNWVAIFRAYVAEGYNTYRIIRNSNSDSQVLAYNHCATSAGKTITLSNTAVDVWHTFDLSYGSITLDGTTTTLNTTQGTANTATLKLLDGSYYAKFKTFQAYHNDVLVGNFVPAKRDSDGEIGMYDTVTNTFFEHINSNPFVAGPEIAGGKDKILNGEGLANVISTTLDNPSKLPTVKAVYEEVAYPDVVYEKAQDIEGWQTGTSIYVSAPNWYFTSNYNYACSGLVDVRDYDTVTWRVFTTNTSYYTEILDKNKAWLGAVRISVGGINRQDYPEMGYIFFTCSKDTYNHNDTVNLTLSDGHKVKNDIEETRRDVSKAQVNSFQTHARLMTFYQGDRLTDKTIVIFANKNNGQPYFMHGTIVIGINAQNQIVFNSNKLYVATGGKASISLILCFDDEGNMKVYLNGELKGTLAYTTFADTDWTLDVAEGSALYGHYSLINADLSDYVSVIENQGWENWMPSDAWMQYAGNVYSGTMSKGGWMGSGFHSNELVKATVTLVNDTSSSKNFTFSNVQPYPSGTITVEANSSVTWTRLIDVKTQKALGFWASTSTTGISATWEARSVGFLWGLDYRYVHDRGAYNLHKLEYSDYPVTPSTIELVPQVLATGAAGSAVGQIRVDANGNLQMYNGTTWKQINNS